MSVTLLSPNFSMEELVFSSTATRLQIPNDPPADVVERLKAVAAGLEQVRNILGDHPIHVDSGYRCMALNKAVCGAPGSAHLDGDAADFVCREYGPPIDIVNRLKWASELKFDQLIQEGTWVHISFAPKLRRQVLTAKFGPNGTSYSAGA